MGSPTPVASNSAKANGFLYKLTPEQDSCAYATGAGNGAYGGQNVTGNVDMMNANNILPVQFSATEVNIPMQPYTQGFPNDPTLEEWFGVCYDGGFTVSQDGEYTFVTAVDDSVAITVDGQLQFLNNDGALTTTIENNMSSGSCASETEYNPYPVVAPSVHLTAGTHSIMIQYMQAWPVQLEIQVWLLSPGETYQYSSSTPTPPDYNLLQLTGPPNGVLACPHPKSS